MYTGYPSSLLSSKYIWRSSCFFLPETRKIILEEIERLIYTRDIETINQEIHKRNALISELRIENEKQNVLVQERFSQNRISRLEREHPKYNF